MLFLLFFLYPLLFPSSSQGRETLEINVISIKVQKVRKGPELQSEELFLRCIFAVFVSELEQKENGREICQITELWNIPVNF